MWPIIKEIFRVIFKIIGMIFQGIWALIKWIGTLLNAIAKVFAAMWTIELMADVSGMPDWAIAAGLSRREYEYQEEQRRNAEYDSDQDDYYEDDDTCFDVGEDWNDGDRY